MSKSLNNISIFSTSVILIICIFLGIYNVSKKITVTDKIYIEKILEKSDLDSKKLEQKGEFENQIASIKDVQKSAFIIAPENKAIALESAREPENLYYSNHAYCFDRARYIDKALRHIGYQTRYAALFAREDDYSVWETLTTQASPTRAESHAVVEVKTANGWMAIDTRSLWIGLTGDNQPVSLNQLQDIGYKNFIWPQIQFEEPWPLLKKDFYVIYGLYSRHGQFYPPYTRYIPDINWGEFILENARG